MLSQIMRRLLTRGGSIQMIAVIAASGKRLSAWKRIAGRVKNRVVSGLSRFCRVRKTDACGKQTACRNWPDGPRFFTLVRRDSIARNDAAFVHRFSSEDQFDHVARSDCTGGTSIRLRCKRARIDYTSMKYRRYISRHRLERKVGSTVTIVARMRQSEC